MSEQIWWREEYWWERKIIVFGPISLSPRQLLTILVFLSFGILVSVPIEISVAGISFGGKAIAIFIVFLLGYIISNRRVKMVPIELQLLYLLTNRTSFKQRQDRSRAAERETEAEEKMTRELVVEDFKAQVPFNFTGRIRVAKQMRVMLYVDDNLRNEVRISPQKPDYRLAYYPRPEDVGTHNVIVKLEGADEPLGRYKLVVRAKGVELLESKKA